MMPKQETRLPMRAREPYAGQVATASKRLLASWQRSEEYGVSLETIDPTWAGSVATDSLFFQCGQEVLTALHQTLANEPLSLMLTDADGLVLNRFSSDTSLLRALDKVHLAPGFAFSEREAGTNGLGLALADRTPSLVRADEHYNACLSTYTCAAVPVLDPVSGRLEGSVNITTRAQSPGTLLLALAQSAASNTSALMLARSQGRSAKPQPKGGVFRVQRGRLEPASGTLRAMSSEWTQALDQATKAVSSLRMVAAIGEAGSGRATLLGQALRQAHPKSRILSAAAPAPGDIDSWLSLWMPELSKPETAVIVENVDLLPAWAARELHSRALAALRSLPVSSDGNPATLKWALTAEHLDAVPQPLAGLVDTIVPVPALRERPHDILPLAGYAAHQSRMREVGFTPTAENALTSYDWPGNIDELFRVVHYAASRSATVDIRHLPPSFASAPGQNLSRIESFERDEIVRYLSRPGATVAGAAAELGISRATAYRRMARFGITMTR